MARLFEDGFDLYGVQADLDAKYGTTNSLAALNTTNGRFGGGCIQSASENRLWGNGLGGNFATIILHAGFFISGASGMEDVYSLQDAGSRQMTLWMDGNGGLSARRGTGAGTEIGSAPSGTCPTGAYFTLEVKCTINNTTGVYEVKVNGTTVINLTSADTQDSGNATVDGFEFGGIGATTRVDDIVIMDDSGSNFNDFIGDVRIDELMPDADTADEDWTLSTGTDSFALVDEVGPNGDTDYIESSTATDRTRLGCGAMPSTPDTVLGVTAVAYARKDDAGARSIKLGIESGASTDLDSGSQALTTTFAYYDYFVDLDPQGGGAWTETRVNAATLMLDNV